MGFYEVSIFDEINVDTYFLIVWLYSIEATDDLLNKVANRVNKRVLFNYASNSLSYVRKENLVITEIEALSSHIVHGLTL
jgi:hypothetical protein